MQKMKNKIKNTFTNLFTNLKHTFLLILRTIKKLDYSILFFRPRIFILFLLLCFFSNFSYFFLLCFFYFSLFFLFWPRTIYYTFKKWSLVRIIDLSIFLFFLYKYEEIFYRLFFLDTSSDFFKLDNALDAYVWCSLLVCFFFFSSLLVIVFSKRGKAAFSVKFINLIVGFSLSFLFFLFLVLFCFKFFILALCYLAYMLSLFVILCIYIIYTSSSKNSDYLERQKQVVTLFYGFSCVYLSSLIVSQFVVLNYEIHLRNMSFWGLFCVCLLIGFVFFYLYRKKRLLHFFVLVLSLVIFRVFIYCLFTLLTTHCTLLYFFVVVLVLVCLFCYFYLPYSFVISSLKWFSYKTLSMEKWQFVCIILVNAFFVLMANGSIDILPSSLSLFLFGVEIPATRCLDVFCRQTAQNPALPLVIKRNFVMQLNPLERQRIFKTLGRNAPGYHFLYTPGSAMPKKGTFVIVFTSKPCVKGMGPTTLISNVDFNNDPNNQYVTQEKYYIPTKELKDFVQTPYPYGFEVTNKAALDAAYAAASPRQTPLKQAKGGYNK